MAKAKADTAGLKQLKDDIKQDAIGSLYIVYGEETYLRDFYLGELKKKIIIEGMEEFNYHHYTSSGFNAKELEEAVNCFPMMAERTLIHITDYDLFKVSGADKDQFIEVLSSLPDYCCVIFEYDLLTFKPDKRSKLYATVNQAGVIVDFYKQEQHDLVNWMKRRFKAAEKEIDSNLCEYFIQRCGDLINTLIPEIEKVCAFSDKAIVTKADIDAVTIPQLSAVVFDLTDAISARNFSKALNILNDLLNSQEPEAKILFMLSKHFRQLYFARLCLESHVSESQITNLLGVHPYVAGKLYQSARGFSLDWCRRAVTKCGEVDFRFKSQNGVNMRDEIVQLLIILGTKKGSKA